MEAQIQTNLSRLEPGTTVIYGVHGKCTLIAKESRVIDGSPVPFLKLEIQRSTFSRSTRQEPAIWIPAASAAKKGLRAPIGQSDVENVIQVLTSREYYFNAQESWLEVLPKLEASLRDEGAVGLAKVLSYLHVLKRKQVVAQPEVARQYELVEKLLSRELSDVLGETKKAIEERFQKLLKNKLHPEN